MTDTKDTDGLIPPHGGYRHLFSYQKAAIIYDRTVYFTTPFFHKYDRTAGQMVQAARSGEQYLSECSSAWTTSNETQIKLTSVARASLEELMIDYEDFLRPRKLPLWHKTHRLVARLRELNNSTPNATYATFQKGIEHDDPEICANAMITLIKI